MLCLGISNPNPIPSELVRTGQNLRLQRNSSIKWKKDWCFWCQPYRFIWSGWPDSNRRSSAPKADAVTKLRYIPMARQTRFELVTHRFVVCYSIQLSYWRMPFRKGLFNIVFQEEKSNNFLKKKEKSAEISALLFFMEHPGGIEPPISELQSLALPLGYGCSVKDYSIPRYFFQ